MERKEEMNLIISGILILISIVLVLISVGKLIYYKIKGE